MRLIDRISFAKPSIPELKKEGFCCVDMHFHSKYSDGLRSIRSIARRALKLGVGVSVTDHNFVLGSLELSGRRDVFSIPGIEVEAKEGYHILFYFYDVAELIRLYRNLILPNKSRFHSRTALRVGSRFIVNSSSDYDCVMVAAHPYSAIWYGVAKNFHKSVVDDSLLRRFDAFEVLAGETGRKRNLRALALASRLNKPITGGSDGHSLGELGRIVTYARADNVEDFLAAVRKGRAFVAGKETPALRRLAGNVVKVKMAPFYPFRHISKSCSYISNRSGDEHLKKRFRKVREKLLRV